VKTQKIEKKVYNCTLCQVTVTNDNIWFGHLNGKRHRNALKRSAKVEMNKIVSSDVDNTGNGESPATKPTGEQFQAEVGVIKKMQVIEIF
jgi:Zinc-finger of C2H2 type